MKLFKSKIFIFVLGLVIAGSISTFAYQMNASQITYEPKDTSWKVTTVKSAIDDIKENCNSNGNHKGVAKLVSGNVNTVGSVVKIGDEEFYIIGKGTVDAFDSTKLLAKYALKDNSQVSTGADTIQFSNTDYWVSYLGTPACSSNSSSSSKPYIYGRNSNLYSIINDYLEKLDISGASGRILTYEEANNLTSSMRNIGTYYWLGDYDNCDGAWYITDDGTFRDWGGYGNTYGIRPVILVPTDEIK